VQPSKSVEKNTIVDMVSEVLNDNYVLREALRMGVINYHALASLISESIKLRFGVEPKKESIVVTIKRYSDRLNKEQQWVAESSLKGARVKLEGGMVEISLFPIENAYDVLIRTINIITQNNTEADIIKIGKMIKIIVGKSDMHILTKTIRVANFRTRNVARLEISLSKEAHLVPGIAPFVSELLMREGVDIISGFMSYDTIILLVEENTAHRAYDIINRATP
jgi:hypothetical protein